VALRQNTIYWNISLKSSESISEKSYIFDEVILEDKELVQKVERLRELLIGYCVVLEKEGIDSKKILDEIYEILMSVDKIQYTEFTAFWKVMDMSYSVFRKLPNKKKVLADLIAEYCSRRRRLYDRLGYSHITVQALYDSASSRRKGAVGIRKVLRLATEILGLNDEMHLQEVEDIKSSDLGYFLPDKGDARLFDIFCEQFKIRYQFGKSHQGKRPDIVLKVKDEFFVIEVKHIKESGGAQDKQVVEMIDFIKHVEDLKSVHYVSFMDGVYFSRFAKPSSFKDAKINQQKRDIASYLKRNPRNFFVNTAGLKEIFKDLSRG